MAAIKTAIELYDAFSAPMMNVIQSVNLSVSAMENLNASIDNSFDTSTIEGARAAIDQATMSMQKLEAATSRIDPAIDKNIIGQKQFNREVNSGADSTNALIGKVKGAIGAYLGIEGIKKAFSFVEDCTQAFDTQLNAETQLISVLANTLDADYVSQFEIETTADTAGAVNETNAIQNSVDEVVVPVSAESRALNAAFDQITEKASEIQGCGIYGDEAMIAAGAEFATYFSDTDAIEMMMDTLTDYAMGMSGGGEIGSQEMVNYATNLGKIMSGSYDAMTKKGFELSDIQKAIIEGTATQEQIVAALGEEYANMSSDMQAAAAISQVVEESWSGLYESMSNTPEGKIIQLNNAWGDMKESIGGQLYPAIIKIVDYINSNWSTIETIVQGITGGLGFMINALGLVIEGAAGVAGFFSENWSWIAPIIGIVTAALIAYNAVRLVTNGINAISSTIEKVHTASMAMQAGVTFTATAAQHGFNSALLACPLVWIIVLILLIIVIIYNVCEAIAKLTGIANSGFGVICGGVNVVIQFFKNLGLSVANIAIGIWNAMCACATDIGVAFNNAWVFIQIAFWTFVDVIMQGLKSLAEFANTCLGWLGVNIDTSGFDFAKDKISELNEQYQEFEDPIAAFNEGAVTFDTFQDGWLEDAFNSGAAWGDGVIDDVGSMLDEFGDLPDIPSPEDYTNSLTAGGIGSSVEDIADSTGAIEESLEITEEDLKYLRDIAEQEAVNRFTTAEITIEQTNHNTVSGKMDLDGVIDGLTDAVDEAVFIIAEGVHV